MSRGWEAAGTGIVLGGVIFLIFRAALWIARSDEEQNISLPSGEGKKWQILCILNGLMLSGIFGGNLWRGSLLAAVSGALLFACATDCRIQQVYQFTWWLAGAASGLLLCMAFREAFSWGEIALYCGMQELIFSRFYGKADCHAFCICAAVLSALGGGMESCLLHMILSFGVLTVTQRIRGNVEKRGRLRRPVAFLPYITFSFWIVACLLESF